MAKQLPVTEFDILTLPDYLQLFKALIPFMEYGMQKKLSMLIRANELKHTLSFYNSPYSCNTFKTCSNSSGINANTSLNDILNNEAIMKTIMAYCPDNIEQLINTYRNFSKMSDMLGMMDIKYTAGMIHISMSNLYDGSINKIDGHIISKKDDKDNHGYGLDSIKRIVDKYDGSMIKSYENGQFEVDIIIYLE